MRKRGVGWSREYSVVMHSNYVEDKEGGEESQTSSKATCNSHSKNQYSNNTWGMAEGWREGYTLLLLFKLAFDNI
jgi:hypothetical protein